MLDRPTRVSANNCLNCQTPLRGPFCAHCGQQDDRSRPNVGHLLGESLEGLTHADSRLWRTLWLLLSRPGFLTREFFEGRRARYLPPFRLYIVLSLVFFLGLSTSGNPQAEPTVTNLSEIKAQCSNIDYGGPFAERVKERMFQTCVRLQQGGGAEELGRSFLKNLPKAMWVLLPLFAAIMLLFWWSPRRLYAEHVLFLVHNHSAIFAVLTLNGWIAAILPDVLGGWLSLIVFCYLSWYTWRGMRVFYVDGPRLAVAKFSAMLLLYACCAVLVLSVTGLATLLSLS